MHADRQCTAALHSLSSLGSYEVSQRTLKLSLTKTESTRREGIYITEIHSSSIKARPNFARNKNLF